jgi:uncharacterized protein YcbX
MPGAHRPVCRHRPASIGPHGGVRRSATVSDAVTPELTVAELYCYPVKSCSGIRLERAEVGRMGIRHDRQWMVVRGDGLFVAQRGADGMHNGVRSLGRVQTAIDHADADGTLSLGAEGMPELRLPVGGIDGRHMQVQVWGSAVVAIDQGPEAADWLSEYLSWERAGRYRLVRMPDDGVRPANRGRAELAFADGYPFMVLSSASLADLNARMPAPLPVDRFRPSIVIESSEPYVEDRIAQLRVGDLELSGTTRCVRCPIPTFDQRTGARGKEPLRTLATYRRTSRGVVFGRNFNHAGTGTIAVGDPVQVLAWHADDRGPGF